MLGILKHHVNQTVLSIIIILIVDELLRNVFDCFHSLLMRKYFDDHDLFFAPKTLQTAHFFKACTLAKKLK